MFQAEALAAGEFVMLFDFDSRFDLDDFRRSLVRPKNIPLYGPVIHRFTHGPIPELNYSEEDLAVIALSSAAISLTSGFAAHTTRALMISRYTSPVALGLWTLTTAAQAYGELTPEQRVQFDMHRHRSR